MDRNQMLFEQMPFIDIERSKFNIDWKHLSTMNSGKLVPFFVDMDGLPGETIKIKTSLLARMQTPIYPVMDNAYIDTYYFAIPYRLVWKHWKEFNGENKNSAWYQPTEYMIPMFKTDTDHTVQVNSINDYMGIPTGVAGIEFSQLPVRAYILTWNEWFRDQNLTAPLQDYTDDSDRTIDGTAVTGGTCCDVYKFHDYFTSALPDAQKSASPVSMPLGTTAPVIGNGNGMMLTQGTGDYALASFNNIGFWASNTTTATPIGTTTAINNDQGIQNLKITGLSTDANKSGLIADLTSATAATINALRLAFATQRILEKDARGGTRYTEILSNHFGVKSPDGRQQRPEYLGGAVRVPINMQQVVQTSETTANSPLAETGAYSATANEDESFTYSMTEHTIILGLCCIRTNHTYQNGLAKQWSRKRRLDFYWPSLAHIGEQPILNKEIYADGSSTDDEVFGYQEAWAEYRHMPNRISGEMRSSYAQSLDAWHYGDDFTSLPVLSTDFLIETPTNIDRTLAVQSELQNQFLVDFYLEIEKYVPMPVRSIPGLVDHF